MTKEKVLEIFNKIKIWFKSMTTVIKETLEELTPGEQAWRGASIGILIFGYVLIVVNAYHTFLPPGILYFSIALLLFPIACGLAISLLLELVLLLVKLPKIFLLAAGVGIFFTMIAFGFSVRPAVFMSILIIMIGGMVGGGAWTLFRGAWGNLESSKKILVILVLTLGLTGVTVSGIWLLDTRRTKQLPPQALDTPNLPSLAETLSDPSERGDYPVATLSYGSGNDKRRTEFAEGVDLVTTPVDGSLFVSNWSDMRTRIWGFDSKQLPLNGRVWYPEGKGPFPLVLVVHGNHLAEDYSDPGYEYLCDLLASRGTLCVSVDQNFLNGSAVGDLLFFKRFQDENDLRGWMLLEHLSTWHDWAEDQSNPFFGQVDLSKIGLAGHSRGGEAVAIAYGFNHLDYYPENASVQFDYGFDIKSLVAIAPVDRQYKPAGEHVPLNDVNYLTLQGSHDMDVISFDGYNAFDRVNFSGEGFFIKSTLHIWQANHGQFNTRWGDSDFMPPAIWLFNRKALLTLEEQTQIAEVYISAFIDLTLRDQAAYLPLFQNFQAGLDWLPDTIYTNAYSDSNTTNVLTFDEDIDLTTGTIPGVTIEAHGFNRWREGRVPTKWGTMHENNAVYLRWNKPSSETIYSITLPETLFNLTADDQLVFSAAQTSYQPDQVDEPVTSGDFRIELVDADGEKASQLLSSIAPLQPESEAQLYRIPWLETQSTSEVVFQTYLFDLADFVNANPQFNLEHLSEIRFVFDRTDYGEILLDDLGFRKN